MKSFMLGLLMCVCGICSVSAQSYQYHVPSEYRSNVQDFLEKIKRSNVASATKSLQKIKSGWEVIWSENLGPNDRVGRIMLIRGPSEMMNLRGKTEERIVNYFFVKIKGSSVYLYTTYFNYKDNYRAQSEEEALFITKDLKIYTDDVINTKTLFPFVLQIVNGKIMDY